MDTELHRIQMWYRSQCNDDWEHGQGIEIGTLDNPGWSLLVDLDGTGLVGKAFERVRYRVGDQSEPSDEDWYVCEVEGQKFKGFGGPGHLGTLLQVFLDWAERT